VVIRKISTFFHKELGDADRSSIQMQLAIAFPAKLYNHVFSPRLKPKGEAGHTSDEWLYEGKKKFKELQIAFEEAERLEMTISRHCGSTDPLSIDVLFYRRHQRDDFFSLACMAGNSPLPAWREVIICAGGGDEDFIHRRDMELYQKNDPETSHSAAG
jgi:hypothetical protein